MDWNILLIDDEEQLRKLLGRIIRLEGFTVTEAASFAAAKKILQKETPDIILCDVKLPDGNGVEMVKELKSQYPSTEIILLTAYGNIADGVQAMRNGAFDYITKGDDNDKIIPLLQRAADKLRLAKKVVQLQQQIGNKYSFNTIIGESAAIKQAIALAEKVAATDTTVLLLGETGTGKEVFAQSIHQQSSRSNKSFVAVNCSAFSKELLESELFGHKAGAFTGAIKDKKGLLEEAHEGSIFLDEIGEMPVEMQARLLRVLETGEFIKVGDTKTIKVNVRIIAATNRDLQKEIETGHFRSDLFYRLSVFQIVLPALRERVKDIPALANYFVAVFAAKTNKVIPVLQNEYVDVLQHYNWPGNIRELKNVIERSVILSDGNTLTLQSLPVELQLAKGNSSFSAFDLAGVEKQHIQKVLLHTKGNKTEAARLMNIGLTTLYRKIEEYKIV
ncbi:MAG: sigma-54-dependent Fis family transcriptional regulator [Chitinophagaceae bacterium]|nr:sigma-54-dependent Fis family transcriptional regulator [Chitinophagaceae bacterium]